MKTLFLCLKEAQSAWSIEEKLLKRVSRYQYRFRLIGSVFYYSMQWTISFCLPLTALLPSTPPFISRQKAHILFRTGLHCNELCL